MVHKKYSSAVSVALLFTAATVAEVQLVRAQQAPTFKLPASVAEGTNIRIDGSTSMAAVNQVLKQRFEQQFKGTQVKVATNGVPAGIQAVLDGQADLAAIGRPLNEQEKAQGLTAVPVGRDKIAILVGANNPFAKSITIEQFAKMFRGEVKNWSEVGGSSLPVKFVDRPDSSDTREAFKSYPVFKQAQFATGATAEKLNQDTTQAVVSQLGNNGISYATANQTKGLAGAKAIAMHGTPPTDPRYPFSQALYYVYKGEPSPAVQSFLGFATAPVGQKAIEQAGVATAIAPTGTKVTASKKTSTAANKASTTTKKADGTVAASPENGNNAQSGTSQSGGGNPLAFLFPSDTTAPSGAEAGLPSWLWWLLPIGSGATLLWMLSRGRRRAANDAGATGTFNAPRYAEDLPNRDDRFNAPYVEGGFDPLQGDRDYSTDAPDRFDTRFDADAPDRADTRLDLDPTANTTFGDSVPPPREATPNLGNLGGAATAGAAGAWSALNNRGKQSRVVLKARTPQEVEAFWDIPAEERQALRQQGGEKLALRLYDVTDIDLATQQAHSVQQFDCDELTQRQRLAIALPDRDYLAEIGYLTPDNQWLGLARSTHVRVPATSGFLGNAAKPTSTDDSTKSFLSEDRGVTPSEPTQTSSAPGWFDRVTHRGGETANDVTGTARSGGDAVAGGAAAGAGAAAWSFLSGQERRSDVLPREANQFVTGETAPVDTHQFATGETETFTSGVGEGRLVLTPRNSRWAYVSWDIPRALRARIDRNMGENLTLRLYDVTDAGTQLPARYEEHDIDDMALSCDVPISQADRSYVAEIGYVNANHEWIRLARSTPAHVPAT